MTRYIYDLSQGGTVSAFNGQKTLTAHGHLATTREYNCGETQSVPNTPPCSAAWNDLKGYCYDALDRTTQKYTYVSGALQLSTASYDGNAPDASSGLGMLTNSCDALAQCAQPTYNALGQQTAINFTNPQNPTPNRSYSYDPDGRTTAISSPGMGTQGYQYDADGRLTQSVEPSTMNSYATLTYGYYPNGQRSTLTVNYALFNANLFSYNYRNDGAMSNLTFNANGATTTIAFGRSSAGRVISRTENTGGAPQRTSTWTYDQYGRLNYQYCPIGVSDQFGYDADGEKIASAYTSTGTPPNPPTGLSYTIRGELISQGFPYPYTGPKASANGTMVGSGGPQVVGYSFDAYMGVQTSQTGKNDKQGCAGPVTNWTFDAAGRVSRTDQAFTTYDSSFGCVASSGSITRQDDAENHQVGESDSNMPDHFGNTQSVSASYQWGLNGHPIVMNNTQPQPAMNSQTIHWDGDQPLFVTSGAALVDVKIGSMADYTPVDSSYGGITFWDRDPTGAEVGVHNSTTVGYTTPSAPSMAAQGGGPRGIISSARPDGISDGLNTFQGVRTYDPQLGSWTSPDAYAGEVHDPMSQKAYMWNRNNSFDYMDPTGYLTIGDVYNFVIGDDIATLRSSQSSGAQKALAVVSIASSLIPVARGGSLVIKGAVRLTERELFTAAATRFAVHSAEHGVEEGSARVLSNANKVKILYRDANGTRRGVMAHNPHASEPGSSPHTQTETRGKTDPYSKQNIIP